MEKSKEGCGKREPQLIVTHFSGSSVPAESIENVLLKHGVQTLLRAPGRNVVPPSFTVQQIRHSLGVEYRCETLCDSVTKLFNA